MPQIFGLKFLQLLAISPSMEFSPKLDKKSESACPDFWLEVLRVFSNLTKNGLFTKILQKIGDDCPDFWNPFT